MKTTSTLAVSAALARTRLAKRPACKSWQRLLQGSSPSARAVITRLHEGVAQDID